MSKVTQYVSEVRSKHKTRICLSLCQARQGYDFPIPSSLKLQRCLSPYADVHRTSARGLCFSWSFRVPANRATKVSIVSHFTWKKMEVWGSQSSNSNAVPRLNRSLFCSHLIGQKESHRQMQGKQELQSYSVPRRWNPENIWQVSKCLPHSQSPCMNKFYLPST